jgi:hypothetical protein
MKTPGRILSLLVLLAAFALPAFSSGPLDGPTPPPKIECLTVEIDGVQLYHVTPPKALNTKGQIQAAFVRMGQELQGRALFTNEQKVAEHGRRIVAAASSERFDYVVGQVCYVLMRYCDPGCTGNGCATLRVPSVQ